MGEENLNIGKILINGVEFKGIQEFKVEVESDEFPRIKDFPTEFSGTLIMDKKTLRKIRRKLKWFILKIKFQNLISNIFKQ